MRKNNNHIFLFIIDAVRKDHLGCYGYERNTSPNIDKLAKQADVYNLAIAPSSFTLASVPSILSGKYPTLLSNCFISGEFTPDDFELLTSMRGRGYRTAMFTANIVTSHYQTNIHEYFDYFWDELTEKEINRSDILFQKSEVVLSAVRKYINTNKDQKHFVVIHLMESHGPYLPDTQSIFIDDKLYKNDNRTIDRVVSDTLVGVNSALLSNHSIAPKYQLLNVVGSPDGEIEDFEHHVNKYIAKYDMGIYVQDQNLGLFFDYLKSKSLYNSSQIIITSDHGELLGEENIYFTHGVYTSPNLINVPLFVKQSSQSKSKRINLPYSLTNLIKDAIKQPRSNKNTTDVFSYHPKSISVVQEDNISMIHRGDFDVADNEVDHFFKTARGSQVGLISLSQYNLYTWRIRGSSFELEKKQTVANLKNKKIEKMVEDHQMIQRTSQDMEFYKAKNEINTLKLKINENEDKRLKRMEDIKQLSLLRNQIRKYFQLIREIHALNREKQDYETILRYMTSSKYYKFWQLFVQFKHLWR